jgi:hypothetical protein
LACLLFLLVGRDDFLHRPFTRLVKVVREGSARPPLERMAITVVGRDDARGYHVPRLLPFSFVSAESHRLVAVDELLPSSQKCGGILKQLCGWIQRVLST